MKNALISTLLTSKFIIWTARIMFVFAIAIVTWKSLVPVQLNVSFNQSDKVLHFGAYFVLTSLALLARFPKRAIVTVCIVIAFGLVIEILQGTMHIGRSFSLLDGVANSAGAFTSFGLWVLIQAGKQVD